MAYRSRSSNGPPRLLVAVGSENEGAARKLLCLRSSRLCACAKGKPENGNEKKKERLGNGISCIPQFQGLSHRLCRICLIFFCNLPTGTVLPVRSRMKPSRTTSQAQRKDKRLMESVNAKNCFGGIQPYRQQKAVTVNAVDEQRQDWRLDRWRQTNAMRIGRKIKRKTKKIKLWRKRQWR